MAEDGDGVSVFLERDGFAIRSPAFDGPFALLLHLIRKEQLDIFDIPISRLTTSYLRALEQMRELAIEPASEFLVMAATLLYIKSRMLVPRRDDDADEDDPDADVDPREALVRRLLEYQRFQEVADALGQRPRLGRHLFIRPPGQDKPPEDDDAEAARHQIYQLGEAFRRLLSKRRFEAPHEIYVERVTIGERIAQIAEILARVQRATFTSLCESARHREELVTTFLALLEMSRLKLIRTSQPDRLGPLYVEARVGAIGPMGEDAAGNLSPEE